MPILLKPRSLLPGRYSILRWLVIPSFLLTYLLHSAQGQQGRRTNFQAPGMSRLNEQRHVNLQGVPCRAETSGGRTAGRKEVDGRLSKKALVSKTMLGTRSSLSSGDVRWSRIGRYDSRSNARQARKSRVESGFTPARQGSIRSYSVQEEQRQKRKGCAVRVLIRHSLGNAGRWSVHRAVRSGQLSPRKARQRPVADVKKIGMPAAKGYLTCFLSTYLSHAVSLSLFLLRQHSLRRFSTIDGANGRTDEGLQPEQLLDLLDGRTDSFGF